MIYLAAADGGLPNLALMQLGAWLRTRGESVRLLRSPRDYHPLFDPKPAKVYGSSIFSFSAPRRAAFEAALGPITWGGTGVRIESSLEEVGPGVDWDSIVPDYTLYPGFVPSIGFLTRGCRLRCGFCVVPQKEGKPRRAASVRDVWRGEGHAKQLHLLDNDAFAPQLRDHWREAVAEIRAGDFRVCFSQGINLRLVDDESAAAIASIRYCGGDFQKKRLYTAWDSIGDEDIFRRGIATLGRAGIPPSHLTVYMLIGYDPRESWETIFYRVTELIALGCEPFPMVYDRSRPELRAFARWAICHLYRTCAFPDYGEVAPAVGNTRRLTNAARDEVRAAWARVASGWRPVRKLPVTDGAA